MERSYQAKKFSYLSMAYWVCLRSSLLLALIGSGSLLYGQNAQSNFPDSLNGMAHKGFDKVSKWHRFFFGENYRKEWSAETKLPVIHLSSFRGGLVVIKEGGGTQTHSLRLKDKSGMEWVLRSVEKYPDAILPEVL